MLPQPLSPQYFGNSAGPWEAAMAIGDFEAAWQVSDKVLAERDPATRDDPRLPYHLRWVWDGLAFEGKHVLVRCYHGLGDTLQFCRFLAPLRRRVGSLTLEVQPELIELLTFLDGPDVLVPFIRDRPQPTSERDLEVMELSHALRLAPTPSHYLRLPRQPSGSKFRVGLCWQSSQTWLPERSLNPILLAPVLKLPNIEFINLQRFGAVIDGLADDCPASIADTAERIARLDLVITVDTMVAHLAGALGTPLWLLLKHEPDWRWLAGRLGSVWYANVRKYRQMRPGDWAAPIEAVMRDLTELTRRGTFLREEGS